VIIGVGVDVVDLARFERTMNRTPALRSRLFADRELHTDGRRLPYRSLAGRFAAKEAFMKAIGESTGIRWHDMQVVQDSYGSPSLEIAGAAASLAASKGVVRTHLSLSHDGGVAVAFVVVES
jgi:holo-[acyl-carrier protein] synthase